MNIFKKILSLCFLVMLFACFGDFVFAVKDQYARACRIAKAKKLKEKQVVVESEEPKVKKGDKGPDDDAEVTRAYLKKELAQDVEEEKEVEKFFYLVDLEERDFPPKLVLAKYKTKLFNMESAHMPLPKFHEKPKNTEIFSIASGSKVVLEPNFERVFGISDVPTLFVDDGSGNLTKLNKRSDLFHSCFVPSESLCQYGACEISPVMNPKTKLIEDSYCINSFGELVCDNLKTLGFFELIVGKKSRYCFHRIFKPLEGVLYKVLEGEFQYSCQNKRVIELSINVLNKYIASLPEDSDDLPFYQDGLAKLDAISLQI